MPSLQHMPWISPRCVKSVARSHGGGACASAGLTAVLMMERETRVAERIGAIVLYGRGPGAADRAPLARGFCGGCPAAGSRSLAQLLASRAGSLRIPHVYNSWSWFSAAYPRAAAQRASPSPHAKLGCDTRAAIEPRSSS